MHVSEKLIYRRSAPGVLCIIESHGDLRAIANIELMVPHLLVHRVVQIEHVTHLIGVCGVDQVDIA